MSGSSGKPDPRRFLPGVDRLAGSVRQSAPSLPEWAVNDAARATVDAARRSLEEDPDQGEPDLQALVARAAERAEELARPRPRRVVNATGVVLHTNLGRAVLAPGAVRAAAASGAAYSDLELDLGTGRRGNRLATVGRLLARLGRSEAGLAVNNNAAAMLLVLDTLARGREVIVSRGELVEIGGSFRVPEILERAGVRLVEVGTTNRTHPKDYQQAIGPDTALLLKVHRSNFEVRGFTAEVELPELVAIGREAGLPVVEDLGSGTLVDLSAEGFPAESFAPARVGLGADLVCFSGDKLLGGPQAGLILGSAERIAALRANPLARALRLDKMSLAALDWTLRALLEGRADAEIPTVRQLTEPASRLEERARSLAALLEKSAPPGLEIAVAPDRSAVGGGSLPGFELDTWVVTLRDAGGADALAGRLRAGPVPVLARVRDELVLLDARTLLEGDFGDVEAALARGVSPERD